jgi:hypothetical protein
VTASVGHDVVDRRRIEHIEPGMSAAPIHRESRRLDVAATAALVERARVPRARTVGCAARRPSPSAERVDVPRTDSEAMQQSPDEASTAVVAIDRPSATLDELVEAAGAGPISDLAALARRSLGRR